MKIKKISLQNYKRFVQERSISFLNPDGEVNDSSLIVGNNGSGKTSILQAIVVLLAGVIREDFNIRELDWPGFEFRHLQTGDLPLKIEAEILFDENEIETTRDYAERLKAYGVKLGSIPSSRKSVSIWLDYYNGKIKAIGGLPSCYQFSGYQYAKRLAALTSDKSKLFEQIGNIYWYTEQRNSHNITNLLENKTTQLDDIRNFLASAYNYHIAVKQGVRAVREGEFDFYEKLETIYKKVFKGREFVGASPRFDVYEKASAPDFFLTDGRNQYELSGMSAGERAIFPILMDFARWNINNSIVIIDELELHLHPPLQQTLVRTLSDIGRNNQFIFTSHSNSIISMFDESENQIIRLGNE